MGVYDEQVAAVLAAPEGPQVGAFFDFDGTVIAGYSALPYLREHFDRGDLSWIEAVDVASQLLRFRTGKLGFSALMAESMQFIKGTALEEHMAFGEEMFEKHIARMIYPESRALVRAHLKRGHTVVILSSATDYQVAPVAKDLGIEHVACTHLQVRNGKMTGKVFGKTCFGEGKVRAAEKVAKAEGVDFRQSFFYSDGEEDLPMFERVGNPSPLNPGKELARIARERGWPVQRFTSRGRPGIVDRLRSGSMTGTMLISFLAALPVKALTGSQTEAQNFLMSLFSDLASVATGMKLKVKNEHYVWQQRPAVFIFNHQSNADLVVMTRLVRRDLTGVGKQEIRDMPVVGKAMEFAGVVFIDRKNSSSAIKAMEPLVDVIRNEGKSVALAPEGTRSVTDKLLPFKKGAFYLAMQAGVPIVPVVIHNSSDIQPKGDSIYHPGTVEVEVLPPEDTSDWTVRTMNRHVKRIRGRYLEILGQAEEPA